MNAERKRKTIAELVVARNSINEAIRQINHSPNDNWVWRKLVDDDYRDYAGVEDENARICNIEIDGFVGDILMESNLVEIHIYENDSNDQWMSFYRDFGKQDGNDPFTNDSELGYIFGKWVVQELTDKVGIGIDDIYDIFGMKSH